MAQRSAYEYNKTHAVLQATLQKNLLNNKNAWHLHHSLHGVLSTLAVYPQNSCKEEWRILTNDNKEDEQFVQVFIWTYSWAILFLYSAHTERCPSKYISKQLLGFTGTIFT